MNNVKILVQGYAKEIKGAEFASCSTTLITENGINVIVDPGMDRKALLKSLQKENLSPRDINYVILTHYHPDHSLLSGIFNKAKVVDNGAIYSWDGKIKNHNGRIPKTDIKIIKTPGHDPLHCSVLIDSKKGKIIIAGDVFWWWDEEEQKTDPESLLNRKDPYVKDEKALLTSRRKILQLADYIIPGHGKMFKVEK